MFRASDIYGARAGPQGPAAAAASQRAPPAPPPQQAWSAANASTPSWGANPSWPGAGGPGAGGGGYGASYGGYGGDARYSPYGAGNVGSSYNSHPGGYEGPGQAQSWQGSRRPPGPKATPRPQVATPQPTPNTIVVLGAGGLPHGCEKDIEEKVREVCIEHGFSIADEVRYVSASTAYIDFPYQEVCHEFMKATGGNLKLRTRSYKLQHSSYSSVSVPQVLGEDTITAADGTVLGHPTDQLMVRQIGDMDEDGLMAAFVAVVPLVKSVRILNDRRTGKSKGFGFVQFWSVSESETAMSRIHAAGGVLGGRRVSLSYAKPMTQEAALEGEVSYRNEQTEIKAQAQSALGGINADMWANYLQFFDEKTEKETAALIAAKKAKLQAASDAKEAERLRVERAEREKAQDEEESWVAGDGGAASSALVPLSTAPPPSPLPPSAAPFQLAPANGSLSGLGTPAPVGSWTNPSGGGGNVPGLMPQLNYGGLGAPSAPMGSAPGAPGALMRPPLGGPPLGFAGLASIAKPS